MTAALIEASTGRSLGHDELKALTGRFASMMTAGGNKQLVLIVAKNRINIIAVLQGAWQAGHAVMLVDPSVAEANVRQWIAFYAPSILIVPQDYAIRLDDGYEAAGDLEDLGVYTRPPDGPPIHPDLALLLTTSGSTGSSKMVRLARRNLDANISAVITALGITPQDRAAAHMPLAYSYGLSVVNTHLAAGASLVLIEDGVTDGNFWKAMREYNVTTLPGVPHHFDVIEKLGLDRLDVPNLRVMTQAGGRMEPERIGHFAAALQKRGGRLFVMYGQTEAAPRMTILPPSRALDKSASVGLPLRQGKITIEDGEIIYNGPNVMMGYAENRGDLALGDEMKGRLATGDLGTLDEEGYLFITGRKRRFAKIDGMRIDLGELESIASAVAPTVIVEQGDRLVLFTTGDSEAVRRHVVNSSRMHASRLTGQKIAAFPLLANGKIDMQGLRKLRS